MITDYQIQPHTRRCSVTGRELRPGEKFYTALFDEAAKFVRRDYAGDAWQGPPEGAFSFWAGKVPAQQSGRRLAIDDDLLLDCFTRLEGQDEPGRVQFRYVLALLLMRRKRLRFEEACTEAGREVLCLRCPMTRATHRVISPGLTDEQMASVQDEVFRVLGWE